jgi:hypothetical protein
MLEIDAILLIDDDGAEITGANDDRDWGPWPVSGSELASAGWERAQAGVYHIRLAVKQNLDGSPQFISITER